MTTAALPFVLFGACDRHNLGDLLFPHLLAALLPDARHTVAGLAARDLRPLGGHRVLPLADAIAAQGGPFILVHAGGELLTCTLVDAALMLAQPDAVPRATAGLPSWAQGIVGGAWPAPYVAGRDRAGGACHVAHLAVGGVTLDRAAAPLQAAISTALREADWVSVRDVVTRDALARRGIAAALLPDTAVLVRELYGARIAAHAAQGEPARLRERFPGGWLALQFSLDFADDASLNLLAEAGTELGRTTGLPLVLFRAGAAPMHDDLDLYRRFAGKVDGSVPVHLFASPDIWDICAVIAHSRGFLGSSLHGRIVALAYGLPRASLVPVPEKPNKLQAFVRTWELTDMPGVTGPEGAAAAMLQALSRPGEPSRLHATRLAAHCRAVLAGWLRTLPCRA